MDGDFVKERRERCEWKKKIGRMERTERTMGKEEKDAVVAQQPLRETIRTCPKKDKQRRKGTFRR